MTDETTTLSQLSPEMLELLNELEAEVADVEDVGQLSPQESPSLTELYEEVLNEASNK